MENLVLYVLVAILGIPIFVGIIKLISIFGVNIKNILAIAFAGILIFGLLSFQNDIINGLGGLSMLGKYGPIYGLFVFMGIVAAGLLRILKVADMNSAFHKGVIAIAVLIVFFIFLLKLL